MCFNYGSSYWQGGVSRDVRIFLSNSAWCQDKDLHFTSRTRHSQCNVEQLHKPTHLLLTFLCAFSLTTLAVDEALPQQPCTKKCLEWEVRDAKVRMAIQIIHDNRSEHQESLGARPGWSSGRKLAHAPGFPDWCWQPKFSGVLPVAAPTNPAPARVPPNHWSSIWIWKSLINTCVMPRRR